MRPHAYFTAALLLLLLLPRAASAQRPEPLELPRHSFVRYDANHLHYDSNSVYINRLFDRWRDMSHRGQGDLNIVHIGSSHVQAGILPDRIRCNILAAHPDLVGPRGLIFPYSAAPKCNNPADYRIHCPQPMTLTRNVYKTHDTDLGACGIAVTASGMLTEMQIVLADGRVKYHTTGLTLIGHSNKSIIPRIRIDDKDYYPTFVDQNTDRYVYHFDTETDSLVLVIPCGETDTFTVGGIYLNAEQSGISYHSIGVNGASLNDYLRCRHFVRDIRLLHPDLVIFGIGINDAVPYDFDTAAFRQQYLTLTDSIRKVNPECAFIFITNNDSFRKTGRRRYSVNNNGLLAREVFYRLAHDTDGAVWDQFEVMGGLKSMNLWYNAKLAKADRVHFTVAGYTLMADLFTNALFEALYTNAE